MRRFWILLLAIAAIPLPSGWAQDDSAVPLPPFIVEEATKGPPWRYAQVPGFEILSRCPDRVTRGLTEAHYRLHALLGLLLPEQLQLTFAVPKTIIYYDEELQSAASKEVMAAMVREQEKKQPPPAMELQLPGRFGGRGVPVQLNAAPRFNFLPNLRLTDKDAMTVFALVREGSFNSDRLVLTRDYLSYLLFERTPTLPGWYAAGVLGLYDGMEFETGALKFGPLVWVSEAETDALKQLPPGTSPLRPLAQFLTTGVPARSEPNAEQVRERWKAQATLLVRWALDGRTPAQRAAFADFIAQASFEPVTETAFQRACGADYATADAQLAAYLPVAVKKSMTLKPEHAIKVPKVELRDADESEISRVKGDWERLEVAFVQKRSPELAPKYLEQARRTLLRAYDHGDRNPALLANLGLCECDAGDDGRAREFLEAAARRGPLRPRANYELGRLRFAELQRHPEGVGGTFSLTQMSEVLTPLFAARAATPAIPEVYELIGQTWSRSSVVPSRGHLAVLDEGVRFFPRRVPLVYQLAVLHAGRGDTEDALALIKLGLHVATDDAERQRFAQLQARIAAAPRADAN
jgi:hypothetical protein